MTGLLNGKCSPSAFALNQGGDGIATLISLGVIGIASLVTISYKKWEQYTEKVHRDKMLIINKLHDKHLRDLYIPGGAKINGFPQIFQVNEHDKTIDSLHYNDDELEDIGCILPEVPVVLTKYRQSIVDAMFKLKEYYFDLSIKDDITKGVLSYLLNMLQNRCLSFVGYDYDIAYLRALTALVSAYASLENTENNQHFSRLKGVYSPLMYALQELERHKESLSLQELVNDTRNICLEVSNTLLRQLLTMMTPEKHQYLVKTVTCSELSENILRKEYIEKEVGGVAISVKKKITVPDSPCQPWVQGLAQYYLLSLNARILWHEETVIRPESFFQFITQAKIVLQQKKPGKKSKREFDRAMDAVHEVFKNAPNFLNLKLIDSKNNLKFELVKTDAERIAVLEIMANFAHLTHTIISLQGLCAELQNSMDRLGLDFFDDQENFHQIFAAFNTLYILVQEDLVRMRHYLTDIATANKNELRLASNLEFEHAVSTSLDAVEFRVLKWAKLVKDYTNPHPQSTERTKKEVLAAGAFFLQLYGKKIEPTAIEGATVEEEASESATAAEEKAGRSEREMEECLTDLYTTLSLKLVQINQERNDDPYFQHYEQLSTALNQLQLKTMRMLQEPNPVADRAHKALKLFKLTQSLLQQGIDFFSLTAGERNELRQQFIQKVETELTKPTNKAIIDRHHHSMPKLIYENLGFFLTDTRHKVNAVVHICQELKSLPQIKITQ